MATVLDVAEYILQKAGSMTAMKLQKLVYYSQAWNLVWDETPLFNSPIQAWANGPVNPALYAHHRGKFEISTLGTNLITKQEFGKPEDLTKQQKETIDSIIKHYGKYTGHQLSELTHRENPWRLTRQGAALSDGERGTAEITTATMHEYYDAL